ncbi:AAA family ATPase [Oligoflexia bacterium]|nr:AAA family ATPase [Oligoflexia bacterium]
MEQDLQEKMVFIGGPRQVGKTTLAFQFLKNATKGHPAYFNWDVLKDREQIRKVQFPPNEKLLVFDEIHKFKRWRGLIKGLFDEHFPNRNFLVTGSARLDYYRRGGDSLQGRYHYWRLHPFSLGELSPKALPDLIQYGGFPEPFLKGERRFWRRWHRERINRIVHEDLQDLEKVRELSLIELLVDALPDRVGSLLSLNALAEDLEVSPRTVDRWILILEQLYYCFRIAPYGSPRIRATKKNKKLFLWDWAAIPDEGERFENMVACHLLKYCHFLEDHEGHKMELRFLRDTDGREVDFVVLKDRKPLFAIECKTKEKQRSKAIRYFKARTNIPKFYQVHLGEREYGDPEHEGKVIPFTKLVAELGLP